jgi:tetrahydromethanopterin S-methyltransferase subunit C
MGQFFWGAIIASAVCYFYWGSNEVYLKNVTAHGDGYGSGSYILSKLGSGQVAVFHGFVMDNEACQTAADALTRQGGNYACIPASAAAPLE